MSKAHSPVPPVAILLVAALAPMVLSASDAYTRSSRPSILTYDELVSLSERKPIAEPLQSRLQALLTTPFVSNEAFYRGAKPIVPPVPGLGPSVRVVFWNIERGINLDLVKLAFSNPPGFVAAAKVSLETSEKGKKTPEVVDWAAVESELEVLHSADVVVLNEVDWGMKRSGYKAVVEELGQALQMNWAYGTEFVEVDPQVLGTETFESVKDPEQRAAKVTSIEVDKSKLLALHGTAVLSRYPILGAKLVPFAQIGYDWFEGEWNISILEAGKRKAAILLGDAIGREVRRGGRTNLLVTLEVSGLKEGRFTVAATHMENRAEPKKRQLQMQELLDRLKEIRTPVVIAGDLNTTGSDGTPRDIVQHMIKKVSSPEYMAKTAIKYSTGVSMFYSLGVSAYKGTRFQNDPTQRGVSFLAENGEAGLFKALEKFRFADGSVIDERGDPERSWNQKAGKLANSNERGGKGFVRTFQFDRNIGPKGWFKLDWILVKAYTEHPHDSTQTHQFAPHFGRTLARVNYASAKRISDHSPISVDLPFAEPTPAKHQ